MPTRRILSLWFPRLGAERLLRQMRAGPDTVLAVVDASGPAPVLASLSQGAEAAGLRLRQPLRDARAMCPDLLTRPRDPSGEAGMLVALARWAGRFSPWVAEETPDALLVDLTGCAHLFGGEAALVNQLETDCADLGLSLQAGLADTVGAAWALARYAGRGALPARSGDAIDQEARATRSRAAKRQVWHARPPAGHSAASGRIAAPGRTRAALDPLPVAALRLDPAEVAALTRLGLRRIGDLAGQPRAPLARRFGRALVQRLDQAFGMEPEPVSPRRPVPRFALRLSLPDPIGLETDLMAAIDRLLPPLCDRLAQAGHGARTIRLEAFRCDQRGAAVEVGLARPGSDPARIRPLLALKLAEIDAGPGIDALRLGAPLTEPVHAAQHKGHLDASGDAASRQATGNAMDDLIARLGARIGMEALTRQHPADSHVPEKTATTLAAAWSAQAPAWTAPPVPRPVLIWPPEALHGPDGPAPPAQFRWRRRDHAATAAQGPERIAPEWWLDDPGWRSGVRDYWQVTTAQGERLWLFYAHGGTMRGGWFCQGAFL